MSGIEVAGLVLGALPFVLHSVDTYKDGLRRFGTLFKKRKHVAKLARALLLQQGILKELIKSVVLSSGCTDILALQILVDDPSRYLRDPDVKDQIERYLGKSNLSILVKEVSSIGETVNKLAGGISGLVPAAKGLTDDLMVIIKCNEIKADLPSDLAPRIKLLFGITDIKAMIQEIDDGTDTLDRFSRLVLSNCKVMESHLEHTSTGFEKAFYQIRKVADGLFDAIHNGFSSRCHKNHGVRLYLDDRIDVAGKILRQRKAKDPDDQLLIFDLSFYAGDEETGIMFHEAAVQVLNGWNTDSDQHDINPPADPTSTGVTFCVAAAPSPAHELRMTAIKSICTTINSASGLTSQLSLARIGNWTLGTLSGDNQLIPTRRLVRTDQGERMSLSSILQNSSTALPIKPRMQLSLRLACSLLQLQSTQWIAQHWSKHIIFFHRPPSSTMQKARLFDLQRPFIARDFDNDDTQKTGKKPSDPKATLLELGILLLEIWHGCTLEARFEASGPDPPITYYERMVRALEWQDDEEMQGFYGQAVSHCLTGLHGFAGLDLVWDNPKLWGSIYSNVVDPLSKLCKSL